MRLVTVFSLAASVAAMSQAQIGSGEDKSRNAMTEEMAPGVVITTTSGKTKKLAPGEPVIVNGTRVVTKDKSKDEGHGSYLAPGVGIYFPQSQTIRNLFDSTLRISLWQITRVDDDNWRFVPDFYAVTGSQNGNRFLVIPINAAIERGFGTRDGAQPYVRVGAGVTYNDYDITLPNTTHLSGKRWGLGGTAETGVTWNRRLRLSLRYSGLSQIDSLDFSGLTLSLQYGLLKY